MFFDSGITEILGFCILYVNPPATIISIDYRNCRLTAEPPQLRGLPTTTAVALESAATAVALQKSWIVSCLFGVSSALEKPQLRWPWNQPQLRHRRPQHCRLPTLLTCIRFQAVSISACVSRISAAAIAAPRCPQL